MNFKQLNYFLVVAEERQITASAKRLYITQPPLSYQLKQLEKELGTKLFTRTAYGIELTKAGETFKEYAEKMVSLSQQAQSDLSKKNSKKFETLKIGLISSAGNVIPTNRMKNIQKEFPQISIEIFESNTFGIIEKINNDQIDFGIVRTPFNLQGINKKELNADKMVIVSSEDYFKDKAQIKINDLINKPLILYRRFEAIFNASFSHQNLTPYYAVKCDDARTAILWADKGMGVALVPESIAKCYAKSKILVIKHDSWNTHVQLIWKKEKKLTKLMEDFINLA